MNPIARRFWLLVLGIIVILWWYVRYKRSTTSSTPTSGVVVSPIIVQPTQTTEVVDETPQGTGTSYLTMQGFSRGDTSPFALNRVAQATKDYLNQRDYYPAFGLVRPAGLPIGLYNAWKYMWDQTQDETNQYVVDIAAQIKAAIDEYKHP